MYLWIGYRVIDEVQGRIGDLVYGKKHVPQFDILLYF